MSGFNGERILGLVSIRALENGAFFAMANRIGHEVAAPGLEFDSFGHSCIASTSGRILASLLAGEADHIAFEKGCIPTHLIERRRRHELLQPVDPIDVRIARNGRPDGSKCLIGDASEKKELDVV
jgi:hypothetical protein